MPRGLKHTDEINMNEDLYSNENVFQCIEALLENSSTRLSSDTILEIIQAHSYLFIIDNLSFFFKTKQFYCRYSLSTYHFCFIGFSLFHHYDVKKKKRGQHDVARVCTVLIYDEDDERVVLTLTRSSVSFHTIHSSTKLYPESKKKRNGKRKKTSYPV